MKTNIKFTLLLIAILQVFLLMNMVTANSYLIHQTDELIKNSKIIREENEVSLINWAELSSELVNSLIEFLFSVKQIGIVSAQDEEISWNCCLVTKEGAICQDIASITPELCAVDPIPTKCEQVAECRSGCCLDSIEGLCTTKSPKQKCENDDGEWYDDESCLIQECQKGCCVLGDNAQFVTETRCERLSLLYGFEKDFRDLETEIECLELSATQFKGACVLSQGACKFGTGVECLEMQGEFYEDYLCSNPDLETNCERQTSVNCVEGKDEIYWIDSCGNTENIYSSDRDGSWNNGVLLKKEDSCNPNSANINSKTCGNCASPLSSRCSETKPGETHVEDADFVCKDLRCHYTDDWGNKVTRQNGESWCIYDSYIGDGKDTVGSRHWKHLCVNGEIKVEGCADYRGQVCAQSEVEENGKTFSIAACTINEAIMCIGYNNEEDKVTKCNENKHCMVKNILVDEYFYFDMCVPRYPRGFDLSEPSVSCSMADAKCNVYYMKDWRGRWKCEENCNCESRLFTEQMNDLCISLGDCGSYINYIGEGTNNIGVVRAPTIPWTYYKEYANPVKGQYVEPKDINEFLSFILGEEGIYGPDGENKALKYLGTITGGLGTLIWALGDLGLSILPTHFFLISSETGAITGIGSANILGAFSSVFIGSAIGLFVGTWVADWLGISGDAALVMTMAGGVAGTAIGIIYLAWGVSQAWNIVGLIALIIAVIVMIYTWLIGWGEAKEKIVEFTCMHWQAPTGEANCEKCNEDPLKPCTKYRCESLGQVCKLLNEDTENPACQSIPYETNPPVISPKEVTTEGYEFQNQETKRVEIRKADGDCIPEFTPISFILGTDEHAQCKFEFQRTDSYEDMGENYPLEQNRFTENHTFGFLMPSLDSLNVYNVTGDIKEKFGNLDMYVRCQDAWENFNIDEYAVNFCINSGPDLTPAWIQYYSPKDGAFLKYGSTEVPLTIWTNEPAECKYDDVEGKSYDTMENSMVCKTELTDVDLYGWPCNTTLTNLTKENTIYIKCKDQPWKPLEEDDLRNINQDDYPYTLYISESELKIESILPQGEIKAGFEPISVDLEVKTSGGIENGNSACYYKWGNNWIQFLHTFSDSHEQPGLNLMEGNFNIPIKCQDDAENTDYGNATFSLKVDSAPPKAIRVYHEGNYLKLITNEQAECYYDFTRCNFNIDNATSMTTAYSTEHSADWITEQTYHIKCKDIWGNSNPDCAIIVKPHSLI